MRVAFILLCLFNLLFAFKVDFEKVKELAFENNHELKQKRLDIKEAILNKQEIQSSQYGNFYISEEFLKTNQASYVFASKLAARDASFSDFGLSEYTNPNDLHVKPKELNYPNSIDSYDTSINYELPIFTGFKLSSSIDIAKLNQDVKVKFLNFFEQELLYKIALSYNKAVAYKYELEAAKKSVEAVEKLSLLVSLNFKNDMATEVDLLEMKKREIEVKSRLSNAQNSYQSALSYLRFLCVDEKISEVNDFYTNQINLKNLKALHVKAIENREDLKAMDLIKKISKKNVDISKSSNYPQVNAFAKYGFNDNRLSFSSDKDYYMAGVNIKYNLFDAKRSSYNQEKNIISYKKQIENFNEYKNRIKNDVDKAYYNLQNALNLEEQSYAGVELNEVLFEKSKLMYKNQMISITDLLESEANLFNAKSNYIKAKFNSITAKSHLALVSGQKGK